MYREARIVYGHTKLQARRLCRSFVTYWKSYLVLERATRALSLTLVLGNDLHELHQEHAGQLWQR